MTTYDKTTSWLKKLTWSHVLVIGTTSAAGFVLWDRYHDQLYEYLPYLLLLLCPLMHLFMCKGHGSHKNTSERDGDN